MDDGLLAAALAIADGAPVDWSALGGSTSSAGLTSSVDSAFGLLQVERVVRGHRQLLESGEFASERPLDTLLTSARRAVQGPVTELRVEWGPLIVLDKIGRGTFGDVYRAFDPRLDREVALKLLRQDNTERFGSPVVDEGRLLARVRHPNVVTVFGAERAGGRVGIWMEYVAGRTLADEVREHGRMSPDQAVRAVVEVSRALGAVHTANLLHRDVKAHNVMRDAAGRIVLGDFGTGLAIEDSTGSVDAHLAGTPLYLAPEVLAAHKSSVASDLYSLGVLLFFLLSGGHPVSGRTLTDIRLRHASGTRTRLDALVPDLPPSLLHIVDTLLDPVPERRYPTAAAAEGALQDWL